MFLFAFIHQGLDPDRFSDETRGRRETYVFGCSICQFANKWRYEDIHQILRHGDTSRAPY